MSTTTKKRILYAMLLGLSVWPAVHHGLTLRFDMNPWKLFGWSMYCVPRRWLRVDILTRDETTQSPFNYDGAPAAIKAVIDDYANQRWVYGTLLPPDRVAKQLFATYPQLVALTITANQLSFDRASGYYRNQPYSFEYSAAAR